MIYFINTYGRVNNQITYNNLPQEIKDKVVFTIQEREAHLYKDAMFRNAVVLPPHITNLTDTRQWMLSNYDEDFVVMDDDLRFNVRREGVYSKLHKPEEKEVLWMFEVIKEHLCDEVPFVGVSRREGNNRQPDSFVKNTRIAQLWAIRPKLLRELGMRLDRTKTKEDMDLILQILTSGRENLCLYHWAVEGGQSNSAGGCSSYRTHELMKADAEHFASLWPAFVKVVEKETKGSWGGGVRHDVRVQWKKAAEYGKSKRGS